MGPRGRRLPILAMAVALLAGCTQVGGGDAGNIGPAAQPASGGGKGTKVAFVSQVEGIPYFSGFKRGAQRAATRFGLSYTQAGPAKADSAEQRRILDGLVAQGYKAIAISPLDPTSINGSINAARSRGLKMITSDADAKSSRRELFVSQATDQALGATAMDELARGAGGRGQYAIISGAPDTATFNAWSKAAQDRQRQRYPGMSLAGGIRYTVDSADALREAQNMITAYPNLKGILAVPSTAIPGVAQAVQNAGKKGAIAVTGFGSPKTAAPFIKSGVMRSTVLWNVEDLGYLTVWAEKQLVDGKKLTAADRVPGLPAARYQPGTRTLLLGAPRVFTAADVDRYDF